MADAKSIGIPGINFATGQASSIAKTRFAGVSLPSSALAVNLGAFYGPLQAATSHAIAQGGSGQAFVNPGQTAYAFSTALPDKAYSATLIDGASNVAGAMLGPRDMVFGTSILGANYAADGGGASHTYSGSSTFDFGYAGDLMLGLIDDPEDPAPPAGSAFSRWNSPLKPMASKSSIRPFTSLAAAESFFRDDVIDLGADFGPNMDLTFGYTLMAETSPAASASTSPLVARSRSSRHGR